MVRRGWVVKVAGTVRDTHGANRKLLSWDMWRPYKGAKCAAVEKSGNALYFVQHSNYTVLVTVTGEHCTSTDDARFPFCFKVDQLSCIAR